MGHCFLRRPVQTKGHLCTSAQLACRQEKKTKFNGETDTYPLAYSHQGDSDAPYQVGRLDWKGAKVNADVWTTMSVQSVPNCKTVLREYRVWAT